MGSIRFKAFDLGGHIQARRYWKDYFGEVNGIVFLIDVCDHNRISESIKELNGLLIYEDFSRTPFLILGNKVDINGAMGEDELLNMIRLQYTPERPIKVFMCSLTRGYGYGDGFKWFASKLK